MDANARVLRSSKGSRVWAAIKKHYREINQAYSVYYSPGVSTLSTRAQLAGLTPTPNIEQPALELSTYSVSSIPSRPNTSATCKTIQEEADDSGYASEEHSDFEDFPVSPMTLAPYTWQMLHEKQRCVSNDNFSWKLNFNYENAVERSWSMHHLDSTCTTDFRKVSPVRENTCNRASFRSTIGYKTSTRMHPFLPQGEDKVDEADDIVFKPSRERRCSTTLHPSHPCAKMGNYHQYKTVLSVPPRSGSTKAVITSPESATTPTPAPTHATHHRTSSMLHSALSGDENDEWLAGL